MPKPASNSHRIAALDGWRGIAILMVLEDHFWSQQHPRWGHWGELGVTIFFVLSGYLITGNLLRELDSGGIQLRRFYLRRIFRLWPCAWVYLAGITIMISISSHRLIFVDTWQCILFVRNFSGNFSVSGHFWTLSIEEQFYLAWPLMLILFRKRPYGSQSPGSSLSDSSAQRIGKSGRRMFTPSASQLPSFRPMAYSLDA